MLLIYSIPWASAFPQTFALFSLYHSFFHSEFPFLLQADSKSVVSLCYYSLFCYTTRFLVHQKQPLKYFLWYPKLSSWLLFFIRRLNVQLINQWWLPSSPREVLAIFPNSASTKINVAYILWVWFHAVTKLIWWWPASKRHRYRLSPHLYNRR